MLSEMPVVGGAWTPHREPLSLPRHGPRAKQLLSPSFLVQCQEPSCSAKLVFRQKPTKCGRTELFIFGLINNVLGVNIRCINTSIT